MNTSVGHYIGKYEIIRLLGRGGMAEVYEAFQPGTERSVAIKVQQGSGNETEESIARFKREARSIAQLRHTNIVQVFDFDIDRDTYYMVMEYIRGGTLTQFIHDNGPLSVADALRIMIQLADALAYAHEHGVIHRDIKPVNIMFTDVEHKHPVVTDFGIARIMGDPALTADGRFMGSPAYISPEVVRGLGADARTDIYGLGLVFYEMLTGRRPYVADSTNEVVVQHLSAPLPPPSQFNPAVSHSVEMVLHKALAKDRERRYQSAPEFKDALVRTLEKLEGHPVAQPADQPHQVSTTRPLDSIATTAQSSLPFDDPNDTQTRTLPFDDASPSTTHVDVPAQSSRRRPLLVAVLILALVGAGGYLVLSDKQAATNDNPESTQPVVIQATSTLESTTVPLVVDVTETLTATPSPTVTLAPSNTPAPTITLVVPREKENSSGVKPTAAPTSTPTATFPPANRPHPTQPPASNNNPPGAPAQPTTNPGSSGGNDGGGSSGGSQGGGDSSGGSSNPVQDVVQDTVDTVVDTVGNVIAPVQQLLPTLCLLNCN